MRVVLHRAEVLELVPELLVLGTDPAWVHRVVVVSVGIAGEGRGDPSMRRFLRPRGDKKGLESESDGGMTERVRAHLHSDLGLQPDAM